jgi:Rrf2 family protein
MLYRRSVQLAVEVVLLLALEREGTSRRVRDLAAELGVPATYLAKIVQALTRVGLLHALRGPRGGVQLARSAHEIRLWDVLSAVEPVGEFERCFLRLRQCDDQHPCPIHDDWAPIRTHILAMLQKKSMWEMASEAQRSGTLAWQRRQKRPCRRPTAMLRKKDGAQRPKADAVKD